MAEGQELAIREQRETCLARMGANIENSAALIESLGYNVPQVKRIFTNAVVRQPKLVGCTGPSLDVAVLTCIELGLMPDGDQATIQPFWNKKIGSHEAVLMKMIKGEEKLARQAVPGLSITSRVVYEGEPYTYREGLDPILEHTPVRPGEPKADGSGVVTREGDGSTVVAAYAIVRWPGLVEPEHEWMWKSEIDANRARSRAKDGPAWSKSYPEMARKTVKRRLLKHVPSVPGALDLPTDDDEPGDEGWPEFSSVVARDIGGDPMPTDDDGEDPQQEVEDAEIVPDEPAESQLPVETSPEPEPVVEPPPPDDGAPLPTPPDEYPGSPFAS